MAVVLDRMMACSETAVIGAEETKYGYLGFVFGLRVY